MDSSNLTPEQVQALAAMTGNDQKASGIQDQIQYIRSLRQGSPQGRTAGRVYVAASPLEHLGALGSNVMGMRQEKQLQGQLGDVQGANTKAREQYMINMLRAMGGSQQQPSGLGVDPRLVGDGRI